MYSSSRTSVEKMKSGFPYTISLSTVYMTWCAISYETRVSDCFFWNFHWAIYKSWLIRVAGRCWSLVPAAQVCLSRGTCYGRKAHLQWGRTPFWLLSSGHFTQSPEVLPPSRKTLPTSCEDVALQWGGDAPGWHPPCLLCAPLIPADRGAALQEPLQWRADVSAFLSCRHHGGQACLGHYSHE